MLHAAISRHARETPEATAIATLDGSIAYGRLHEDLNRVGHRLAALGFARRSIIGVWMADPYLQWLVLLAAYELGLVSYSFYNKRLDTNYARIVGPLAILTDRSPPDVRRRFVTVDASWLEGPSAPFKGPPASPADPIRLLLSSGTTGSPRQIVWTRQMAEARLRDLVALILPARARTLSLFPPQTGLGYRFPMATLLAGGAVLGIEDVACGPELWSLRPNLIALPPSSLPRLMQSRPADLGPDPDLHLAVSGSLTPRPLRLETLARVTPNFHNIYGASETGLVAYCGAAVLDRHETAAGAPAAGVRIQVVDEADRPLPAGATGRIRLHTDSMAGGYFKDPEATRAAFRDGWFYPGDNGHLKDDGVLVLEGRSSEILNIGGSKMSPDRIEGLALETPGVLDAAAFLLPSRLGAPALCVAVRPGPGFSEKTTVESLENIIGLRPIRLFQLRRIPRNAGGKIQRDLLLPLVAPRTAGRRASRGR